ncbi:MAG: SDR family NAD(P)-dependent oxidoreductase [Mobilicoccus sp.]|nr:SDR family NAD(P)-dependent oxidoreductase [Mobilicoccus sp.]
MAAPETPTRPTALVIGCGDLGTEVGLRLAAHGETVLGLRRRVEVLPPQIHGLSVDLTRDRPQLPDGDVRLVAVILTPDARDEEGYRRTYVGGLTRALDALDERGIAPDRAVLVSSTGVYGDLVGDLDEDTPPAPSSGTQQVLLEAEELFADRVGGTVLRLSGMYGPGRDTFITKACDAAVTQRWTNRIHRDDAAAAVVHLLTAPAQPSSLYLGTDTAPVPSLEVADFIRAERGLPPHPGAREPIPPGRRLHSTRLRDRFSFTYPTYREGYRAVLAGAGERHP